MIGKIKGILTEIHGNEALIATASGLSYQVFVGPYYFGKKGEEVDMYTHLNIKEDEHSLFGFATHDEFLLFRMLKSVDGVGPKTAFVIVQSSSFGDIRAAIMAKDVIFFERIKGIGKKTAQKILLELSSKLGVEFELSDVEETAIDKDALEALKALGFKSQEVHGVLKSLDSSMSLEDKSRARIKKLTTRS